MTDIFFTKVNIFIIQYVVIRKMNNLNRYFYFELHIAVFKASGCKKASNISEPIKWYY